jgi:glyoxylase-like metal-dependent hydrolase (beta-lactamase superfamily II)
VHFSARGKSNPDMQGDWAVSYFPPDVVRIVNRDSPPDIEFAGKSVEAEARRLRRVDPVLLMEELADNSEWVLSAESNRSTNERTLTVRYPGSEFDVSMVVRQGRLQALETLANFPLRGQVPIAWNWTWKRGATPDLTITLEGQPLFEGTSVRRHVSSQELSELWKLSGELEAVAVPGDRWPSRISMQRRELAAGVHLVTGVRTGFGHMVVETSKGLVVGDAPANWVETHQLPPADLAPGSGVSGVSEGFIDYLSNEFPETPIRAVALTHIHDDHAGGARAFAAAGAEIYAPSKVANWLNHALNRKSMPTDRLTQNRGSVRIIPVDDRASLDDPVNTVSFVELPEGPHVNSSLGLWARDAGVFFQSDLHVPRDDSSEPRADRLATECWFAEWAVANLPADTIVINSHSLPVTPVSRLADYLKSERCRNR